MAAIERLVETRELKVNRLNTAYERDQAPYLFYDGDNDELLIQYVPPEVFTIVHYIDEYVALVYEYESKEIVGFHIEDFKAGFLAKHKSLEKVWRLSDAGIQLEDLEDLVVAFRERKVQFAHEMMNYANQTLQPLFNPGNARPLSVPA